MVSLRPQAPGTTGVHQEQPRAVQPQAPTSTASGRHEVMQATPYKQVHFLPQHTTGVRQPCSTAQTQTIASSTQGQDVTSRRRSQERRRRDGRQSISHPATRRDRSSTRGPKRWKWGITERSHNLDCSMFNFLALNVVQSSTTRIQCTHIQYRMCGYALIS